MPNRARRSDAGALLPALLPTVTVEVVAAHAAESIRVPILNNTGFNETRHRTELWISNEGLEGATFLDDRRPTGIELFRIDIRGMGRATGALSLRQPLSQRLGRVDRRPRCTSDHGAIEEFRDEPPFLTSTTLVILNGGAENAVCVIAATNADGVELVAEEIDGLPSGSVSIFDSIFGNTKEPPDLFLGRSQRRSYV